MLFGAPGTGKSTYARYLSKKLNIPWISTGNVFREISQTDPRIKSILDSGQLLPDFEVDEIIFQKLATTGGNFILDGFPRTIGQAEVFAKFLQDHAWKIDHVFHLSVPVEIVVGRMLRRGRGDDTPETVKKRFEVFESETKPVIAFFERLGSQVGEIDNSGSVADVERRLDDTFKDS